MSTESELNFIGKVARKTGLILDPVYTGKAFFGLFRELQKDEGRFPGDVCFLHTGGIFGLLSGKLKFGSFGSVSIN